MRRLQLQGVVALSMVLLVEAKTDSFDGSRTASELLPAITIEKAFEGFSDRSLHLV
jgi:hypothetical protein